MPSPPPLHDVTVVGAGPTGLTLAIALAKQGVKVVLLDEKAGRSGGSRAVCFAKRSLEIFDKLGVVEPMMAKGVKWNVGRIFYKDQEIDRFDLAVDKHSKYPPFINIQQYYVEQYLEEAAQAEPNIEIRRQHQVCGLQQHAGDESARLTISTGDGSYTLETRFVVACDGSKSAIRQLMGLEMQGERFEDRFLISDFEMAEGFPPERWFWFDPPFAPDSSILLHKQPDNHWRLDFKLDKTADSSLANNHEFISEKIKSVVGDRPFKIVWTSIYSFSCKMLEKFVHGPVIFAGDAAHVVSPFGARGANSGIEDADNLAWKLAAVIKGSVDVQLLKTYDRERVLAAKQNLRITSRSAAFIAPPTVEGLNVRNLILENAVFKSFSKKEINCGRLSTPSVYGKHAECENGEWKNDSLEPGRVVKDFCINDGESCLIEQLGHQFMLICLNGSLDGQEKVILNGAGIKLIEMDTEDSRQFIELYELSESAFYLITPHQYVLGRWKAFTLFNAINLMKRYLENAPFLNGVIHISDQDMMDESVYKRIIKG